MTDLLEAPCRPNDNAIGRIIQQVYALFWRYAHFSGFKIGGWL